MYGNDVKSEWRAETWDILSRISDKDAWVLTLAGKRFLDRKIAARHGFRKDRIIGVDIDPKVCRHNNKFSRTVINANLVDVLANWDHGNRPLAVINADFCFNMNDKSIHAFNVMFWYWVLYAAQNSNMVLNVACGREPRGVSDALGSFTKLSNHHIKKSELHRSSVMFFNAWHRFCGAYEEDVNDQFYKDLWEKHLMAQATYRAHIMRMDTTIMSNVPRFRDVAFNKFRNGDELISAMESGVCKTNDVSGHIRAKLAWNTMRNQ